MMDSTDFATSSQFQDASQYDKEKTVPTASISYEDEDPDIHGASRKALERKLVRKVDWRLCTIAGILCSLNLMDSGIISSASVADDFFTDLGLGVGNRYVSSHASLMESAFHTDEAKTVVGVDLGIHGGKCNISVASYALCEDVRATLGILIDHNWVRHYYHGMKLLTRLPTQSRKEILTRAKRAPHSSTLGNRW